MPPELQQYLESQTATVSLQVFVVNLLLTAVACGVLGLFFTRFGATTSNRRSFARNFILLGVTTALIVTVVKSSLALSLGLVGALSIIRFRGAIKDPEELSYLFMSIAIGLGFGANQALVTMLALTLLLVVVAWASRDRGLDLADRAVTLTVSSTDLERAGLKDLVATLEGTVAGLSLRRFDSGPGRVEATFLVEPEGFAQVEGARARLQALSPSVQVTFVDSEGLF